MKAYEYDYFEYEEQDLDERIELLNQLGLKGWVVYDQTETVYQLKVWCVRELNVAIEYVPPFHGEVSAKPDICTHERHRTHKEFVEDKCQICGKPYKKAIEALWK
jgi:hypothetical protein